jgi:hypothetical protein
VTAPRSSPWVPTAPAPAQALRYPDGAHDAEALLVDDRSGDLVVVTRGTTDPATAYRAAGGATAAADTTITLAAIGEPGRPAAVDLRFPQGEAVALSPDGSRHLTVSEGVHAPVVEVRAPRQ